MHLPQKSQEKPMKCPKVTKLILESSPSNSPNFFQAFKFMTFNIPPLMSSPNQSNQLTLRQPSRDCSTASCSWVSMVPYNGLTCCRDWSRCCWTVLPPPPQRKKAEISEWSMILKWNQQSVKKYEMNWNDTKSLLNLYNMYRIGGWLEHNIIKYLYIYVYVLQIAWVHLI